MLEIPFAFNSVPIN